MMVERRTLCMHGYTLKPLMFLISAKKDFFWISHQGVDQPVPPLHHNVQFSIILFFLQICDISIFFLFRFLFYSRGFR
jgi:hypothetical protein